MLQSPALWCLRDKRLPINLLAPSDSRHGVKNVHKINNIRN